MSRCTERANRTNRALARELIITLAIIIAMFYFVPQHVFRVSGKSMNPALKDGDIVVIWKDINRNLTDEIVIFADQRNQLIAHRVIADSSEMVMTKGDSNESPDGWITKEDVIGFVVFVIPSGVMILPPIAFMIITFVTTGYEVFTQSTRKQNGQ